MNQPPCKSRHFSSTKRAYSFRDGLANKPKVPRIPAVFDDPSVERQCYDQAFLRLCASSLSLLNRSIAARASPGESPAGAHDADDRPVLQPMRQDFEWGPHKLVRARLLGHVHGQVCVCHFARSYNGRRSSVVRHFRSASHTVQNMSYFLRVGVAGNPGRPCFTSDVSWTCAIQERTHPHPPPYPSSSICNPPGIWIRWAW